jgi:hypothetical protein
MHGKRWKAQICYGGKQYGLGSFDTKHEAALAYDMKARQHGKPLNYANSKEAEAGEVKAQVDAFKEALWSGPPLQRSRPPSGFYGVSAHRNRWVAQISYDSKQHHLGTFNTKHEAALAYDREARKHREKRPLNYDNPTLMDAEAAAQAGWHKRKQQSKHTLRALPQTAAADCSGAPSYLRFLALAAACI